MQKELPCGKGRAWVELLLRMGIQTLGNLAMANFHVSLVTQGKCRDNHGDLGFQTKPDRRKD